MTATAQPIGALLLKRWRDPAAWMTTADIFVVLLALSLPWSTSLVGIFAVVTVLVMLPTVDAAAFIASLKRPISAVPIALFALALVGTLWSDARWGMRFYAVAPTAKFLLLPLLFYHFERSQRGLWVFTAFLASCVVLLAMSWLVDFYPNLTLKAKAVASPGVFVKNYIDQSQEFALCAVALAFPIASLLRAKKIALALLLSVVALGFLANMAFVIVSRTALVTIPIMLAVFALLHLRWQTTLMILCAAMVAGVVAWAVSPLLQEKISSIGREYRLYEDHGATTSVGERLEFWRKSLLFFVEAPIVGHGTGSTEGLFEQAAAGQTGIAAEVIRNPHNQTLNVAVQWGVIGIVVLYAMWFSHLALFRGEGLFNWIGLLVVVQNIFTSLFNSHLFDFHEGWMYVLGVGVAGGLVLSANGTAGAHARKPS
ncbi:MAG: O-antigen ligase family protein [Bradyrhizobium sp.]|uniref:O-antigen ligase family protein n=1 Tax=Bradyrhizobium sp. TaxID=376 RepID=UPI003C73B6BA